MAGILAFVCFLISFLEHGAALSTSNHWFDSTALMLLGLVFLAWHLVYPIAIPWRR
jgi:hypothetical protein